MDSQGNLIRALQFIIKIMLCVDNTCLGNAKVIDITTNYYDFVIRKLRIFNNNTQFINIGIKIRRFHSFISVH